MEAQSKQVISKKLKPRKLGLLRGKIWVSPDFDEEDEEINKLFYEGDIFPKGRNLK